MEYFKALQKRRSIRTLTNQIPLSEEELIELIEFNIKHSPSSYNSHSPKLVLLLGDEHIKFWDLVLGKIKELVNEEQFSRSKKKLSGFQNGFGTILFFDDSQITEELKRKFPLYKDSTEVYSEHNNAILQTNIWTSLAQANIGASLQHYNALVKDDLEKEFNIGKDLRLIAQMPFGGINEEVSEKQFKDLSSRLIILK